MATFFHRLSSANSNSLESLDDVDGKWYNLNTPKINIRDSEAMVFLGLCSIEVTEGQVKLS